MVHNDYQKDGFRVDERGYSLLFTLSEFLHQYVKGRARLKPGRRDRYHDGQVLNKVKCISALTVGETGVSWYLVHRALESKRLHHNLLRRRALSLNPTRTVSCTQTSFSRQCAHDVIVGSPNVRSRVEGPWPSSYRFDSAALDVASATVTPYLAAFSLLASSYNCWPIVQDNRLPTAPD